METVLWSVLLINRSVDCLFIFDIFLNFFVAIVDPEDGQPPSTNLDDSRNLRGWFWIDVISVMPFDRELVSRSDEGKLKILRVLRPLP